MPQKIYIPNRGDIAWLDFKPQQGKEIGKYRPAYILSAKEYNVSTGLIICCPISTQIRGGPTEVPVSGLEAPSVVAANLVQTLSWKRRNIKFIKKSDQSTLREVLVRLVPLIGGAILFEDQ